MTDQEIHCYVAQVLQSERDGTPLKRLRDCFVHASEQDAYQVQREVLAEKTRAGHRQIGWKIAYAGAATRASCGISEPAYGSILEHQVTDGAGVPLPRGRSCKLEPEVIVVLNRELSGARVTVEDVAATCAGVMMGFEFVVPKLEPGAPCLVDEIAENMSFGLMITDGRLMPLDAAALPEMLVQFHQNEQQSAAPAGVVMESTPLASVAWLAEKLYRQGLCLKKGDHVLTGSPVAPCLVKQGEAYLARFAGLGEIKFVAEKEVAP